MVVLLPFAGRFMMYVAFFETQAATMLISEDAGHWQNFPKRDALVFVISPGLQKCVQVKLTHFLAHRMGLMTDVPLKNLEDEEQVSPLPPFDIA